MADLFNAAFYGHDAEVRQLIDRGGDVHFKNVRRRLCRAPAARPPRRRVRALRPKENRLQELRIRPRTRIVRVE